MKFPSFEHFTVYLDSLGLFSMRLGLDRMHAALDRMRLTRPESTMVHVVGTNGKGSTSAFLAALAQAHGLRVAGSADTFIRSTRASALFWRWTTAITA